MPRFALVVGSLIVIASCKSDNPQSCDLAANVGMPGCADAPTEMPSTSCTVVGCGATPSTPVCDATKDGGTCVQCTTGHTDQCTNTTPRCEADACVACVDDQDCGGTGVCLLDGSCASADTIIHASSTGSTEATCGAVGAACDLKTAVELAVSPKNVIKVDDDGPYVTDNLTIARSVLIDARGTTAAGAVITRNSSSGPILMVTGGSVTIIGGTIQGVVNGNGDGIVCTSNASPATNLTIIGTTIDGNDGSAINSSLCTLDITTATFRGNSKKSNVRSAAIISNNGSLTVSRSLFASNLGGGISVSNGTFAIVGNVFSGNGDASSSVGGILIVTPTTSNRLEFNTLASNQTQVGTNAPGVHCTPLDLVARNNIIWGNTTAGLTGVQIGSNCKHAYSDIQQTLPTANDAGHNLTPPQDPLFNTDFSVKTNSPVRGGADPTSSLTDIASKDMAGKPRSASPSDIGAYLVPTQ